MDSTSYQQSSSHQPTYQTTPQTTIAPYPPTSNGGSNIDQQQTYSHPQTPTHQSHNLGAMNGQSQQYANYTPQHQHNAPILPTQPQMTPVMTPQVQQQQVPQQRTPVQTLQQQVEQGVVPAASSVVPTTPGTKGVVYGVPPSHSMIELGRKYTLEVVQQPQRARMCGFGDKDRRPITPPPCVRLVITDAKTGLEIDTNDIEYGYFILHVDLWDARAASEVNLVKHTTNSPAISATVPTSYSAASGLDAPSMYPAPTAVSSTQQPYQNQYGYNQYGQPPQQYVYNAFGQMVPVQQGYMPPTMDPSGGHQVFFHTGQSVVPLEQSAAVQGNVVPSQAVGPRQSFTQLGAHPGAAMPYAPNASGEGAGPGPGQGQAGMFTRNLIGSLCASAARLADPSDRIGIWFVLQDLSIRTEGSFRLRFSFCNVGAPSVTPNGNPANLFSVINKKRAPILASCFSDSFTVYSAKKFPGVVESTPLSRCFATQGVKIPIRKDGGGGAEGGRSRKRSRSEDDD